MRRFELVEGNTARFWEIDHFDETVVTRSGTIGKSAKEREKTYRDDMEAEVEFDKQIHAKRRQGYVEVTAASEPLEDFEPRPLELRPLDGSAPETFSGEAMAYLLWRMVEVQLFDRHRTAPDLSRWGVRAWRSLGLDAEPGTDHPHYAEWLERKREASTRDRAPGVENHMVAAFKFREGQHWLVSAEECELIAQEAANRKPKRRKDKAREAEWLAQWVAFHQRAAGAGGYEVFPVR